MDNFDKSQSDKCKNHDKGHCLHGNRCQFQHSTDICRSNVCNNNKCKSRHPLKCVHGVNCSYLRLGGCAYFHEPHSSSNIQLNTSGYEMIRKNSSDGLERKSPVYLKYRWIPDPEELAALECILAKIEVRSADHLNFRWIPDPDPLNLASYGRRSANSEETYSDSYDSLQAMNKSLANCSLRTVKETLKSKIKKYDENYRLIIEQASLVDIWKIRCKQIEIVGSERIYSRVNNCLKDQVFEPLFAREQFKLYAWREAYFEEKFGSWPSNCIWTCHGDDDEHTLDTIPFQITENFDYVTEIACSKRRSTGYVYFDYNEESSAEARLLFDASECPWDWDYQRYDLSFSEKIHMICGVFQNGPPSLEELCLKKILEYDIDQDLLPTELVYKAEKGMYDCVKKFRRPNFLSRQGDRILDYFLFKHQNKECEPDCFCQVGEEYYALDDINPI